MDRVARTEFDALWFLIPFAAVAGLFAGAILPKDRNFAAFFGAIGAFAMATFSWAWFERRAAHRTLERLQASQQLEAAPGAAESAGDRRNESTPRDEMLRQYTVLVGFLVLGATFQTRFHGRHRPVLATLTTLLFGWWTFPWGPVRTVRTIASNLRGGTARSKAHLLAELRLRPPPPSAWWRRLLDFDSKNPVRIASRLATLGMVVLVTLMVVTAFVNTMLAEAPSP